jgi:hypothetical protein
MCKEMPVILVNKVVDLKRIIGKNGWPRRRGTRSLTPPKNILFSFLRSGLTSISICELAS